MLKHGKDRLTPRQQKISVLSRKERARLVTPLRLATLSQVFGTSVTAEDFLSLPETELLARIFNEGYAEAVANKDRRFFRTDKRDLVFRFADEAADALEGETALLLNLREDYFSALRWDACSLLRHAARLICMDGDSLRIVSADQTEGLLVDWNPDDVEENYEIAWWGERWKSILTDKLAG